MHGYKNKSVMHLLKITANSTSTPTKTFTEKVCFKYASSKSKQVYQRYLSIFCEAFKVFIAAFSLANFQAEQSC